MAILITGGLGYIGSHIAKLLKKKSVIIDNQSNSQLNFKKYLPEGTVYLSDINKYILEKVFTEHNIQGVIHLAGFKSVNESVLNPLKYYENNIGSSIALLEAMHKFKINKFIFSSSATVYGSQNRSPLNENMILRSVNPYASTKIIIEQLLSDYALSNSSFKAISLRYFNPIGADVKSNLNEKPTGQPQNIMPILMQAASEQKVFSIYGNNYETHDGTCIRDYLHVKDLALAHVLALKKIHKFKGHTPLNIGLGKGLSVLEVISLFEKVNQVKIKTRITARRKGDVAISFADNKKVKNLLQWKPQHSYETMIQDAWQAFRKKS
ncbi:UDP-glucose 4-epimerase GalE [Alphaproteobacteria bacterium]|nr:UDP-glucose 4-epimerase GalE [Alphaproteobacteria bacterium]